jgi:hypothetical protein
MFEASRELEQNLAYGEYIEQGVSKEEAKEMSGYVGAINASFELIGLRGIGKAIPGFKKLFGKNGKYLVEKMFGKPTMAGARKMVVARYGEALGTEMITEVLQESVTMLGGEILKSRDGQPYENMMTEDDWIRALTDITVQTLYGTIFIGGVGPAVSYIGDSRRAKRAQVTGAYLKGIGEGSTDLEMVKDKRLLPKVKEFFQRLGQEGPVDSIRFDTESWVEYWDSQGQDAGVVSEQFGVDLASLEAEGGDVVIDLETFGEKLAHTDHFNKELWKDAKTDAEAMTYREARDFLNNSDERIEELKAELTEAFGVEVSDDFDRIAEIVAGELVSQGNFDKKAADQQASLMASVFTTQALRNPELGFTPFDLFVKRFGGLRMDVRETAAAPGSVDLRIDPLLDTIRAGNIPDQRQIFGDTLVDFVVRNGKLNDEGGELAARDYKAYGRAIVSSKGLSLDGMAELAHEQGYIAERDPQLLLDMLDRELKDDQPVFSRFQSDEQQAEQVRAEELNLLDEYLIMEGIDIQNMTNEQVRKAMSERRTFEQTDDQALKDLTDLVVATLGSDKLAESYASDLMKLEKMIPRVSDEQDFGDLKFTDRINFKGLPGTRKRSAQKQFDIAVKKRNSLKKLLDCMNASK